MSDGEETPGKVAIGISFGNSYSSIAQTIDGKAEVIANEEGDRQIPTVLSYVDGEELHGTQAKAQIVRNPKNTVAYFRDFLGKDFKSIDPTACHASAHPKEQGSSVAFPVKDSEEDKENDISVTEITTRHLRRLQQSASDYLGKEVTAAVVTVPTNFTDDQRKALEAAAKATNLEILQFIHEPAAALLAYDARPSDEPLKDKVVVLADLGGTRSDVAVIASRGGVYTILATSHDYELSGAALDQVLMDYAAKEFMKKHKTDPRQNERSLAKLKLEAEAVKKSLSIGASASFSIESLADGVDFSLTVNRTRYELLANKLFAAMTRLIESAIQKAELDPLDVGEIVLSGGTSHTPKISRNLQSAFPPRVTVLSPVTSPTAINPSELAVRGAAIQASLIAEFEKEDIDQNTHPMVTVTPHLAKAVGIAVVAESVGEEVFEALIEANTAVPVRRTVVLPTPKEGGDVLVRICEGISEIKVSKVEKTEKPAVNGEKDDDDSDEDLSEEEDEEIREKLWKAERTLAEAAVRGVKKGGKVEVQVSVGADLSVSITAREVGGKGGVRGNLEAGKIAENGNAS